MNRNETCIKMTVTMLGASVPALIFASHSFGQCCQTPCGSTAAQASVSVDHPARAPAQRCCPSDKSWRQCVKPNDPRAAHILDLAQLAFVQLSEFYEKLTFAGHSTKWSSWCSGKSKTPAAAPCTPGCCQKPATGKTPGFQGRIKSSG